MKKLLFILFFALIPLVYAEEFCPEGSELINHSCVIDVSRVVFECSSFYDLTTMDKYESIFDPINHECQCPCYNVTICNRLVPEGQLVYSFMVSLSTKSWLQKKLCEYNFNYFSLDKNPDFCGNYGKWRYW